MQKDKINTAKEAALIKRSANINAGKLCETLTKHKDFIGYIHVADAPGRAEPGTGAINCRRVFECLREIGYDRTVCFALYPKQNTKTAVRAIMQVSEGL